MIYIKKQRGAILALTAVVLTALLSMVGLVIDFGYAYDYQTRAQTVADAAALAAAIDPTQDANGRYLAADEIAIENGYTAASVEITKLSGGAFDGYYQAIVTVISPTYFLTLVGRDQLTIRAIAVAGAGNQKNCMLLNELIIGNNLVAPACEINVSKKFQCDSGGKIDAIKANILGTTTQVGSCNFQGTATSVTIVPTLGSLSATRPDLPSTPSTCNDKTYSGNGPVAIPPGCYNNLKVEMNNDQKVAIFTSGNYFIKGVLDLKKGRISGTNISFYLIGNTSANTVIVDAANVNLRSSKVLFYIGAADSVLTFNGIKPHLQATDILFYTRSNQVTVNFNGNDADLISDNAAFFFEPGTNQLIMDGVQTNIVGTIIAPNATLKIDNKLTLAKPTTALPGSGAPKLYQ